MPNNKICIIYKIINILNDKMYIGQTWQKLFTRFYQHKYSKDCPKLYNAMVKYGINNFIIEPICSVMTQKDADEFENYFISKYNSIKNGYNIKNGGSYGRHSEETKKKLTELNLGENNPMFGKCGALHHNYGKQISEEQKQKLLNANLGKIASDATKQKMSEAHMGEKNHNYGKSMSDEQKRKISIARTGTKMSKETKQKISIANSGRQYSELDIQKYKDAAPRGEMHHAAVLTNEQAEQIRREYLEIKSYTKLARKYGVSRMTITRIIKNESYKCPIT